MEVIPYGRHDISEDDIVRVVAALRGPAITQGPTVAEFEQVLAATVGAHYAVVFNSGTAALHAAYAAAGVGVGAGVLTSPITFAATANAALYLGGNVVFRDICAATVMLDPETIMHAAPPQIRVVAPVHFGGHVAEVEAFQTIAGENGWVVVEDAAHAIGASYRTRDGKDHQVGACAHSDMCCFSFHPVKHITTGEGGAVCTNSERYYRYLLRFRSHGITRDRLELIRDEGPWYYEQQDLGFNYRITDFQCALGLSQLSRLRDSVARRRALAAYYDGEFRDCSGVRPVLSPAGSLGSYHLYVIRVNPSIRGEIFGKLRSAGIGVNVHYIPVYHHPYYRARGFAEFSLPAAEEYYASAITLPMFPGVTQEMAEHIVKLVKRFSTKPV